MGNISSTSPIGLPEAERVVIIGGGFSGVMTAAQLTRLSRKPLRVTVVNAYRPRGRGVAYGTHRMELLLNVAARNMSAFPDLPDHFFQWLRTRSDYDHVTDRELRERFIPRAIYGDYLRSILHHHCDGSDPGSLVKVDFVDGEALDIDGDGVVYLSDGRTISADRVVLATGNESPAELPGSETLQGHPAWIGNPWLAWESKLPSTGGTVVLLGTGLTTVDAVITVRALGWPGTMHAVSRHGWLPHSHFRGIEYPEFPPQNVDLAELGLKKLLDLIEVHCAKLRELGQNPAIIVDKMRPHTQRIWQNFSVNERRDFARHYAARWNIMRHRIAPEIHAQVITAQLTGQLQVHSGLIERLESHGTQIRVHVHGGKVLEGDLVINATGPQSRFSVTQSVLLQNLLKRGLIAPDELDMGVRVDAAHTAIDGEGKLSPRIVAMGPILRGTYWETIAVPELRGQARRVAETLLNQTPWAPRPSEAVEYII